MRTSRSLTMTRLAVFAFLAVVFDGQLDAHPHHEHEGHRGPTYVVMITKHEMDGQTKSIRHAFEIRGKTVSFSASGQDGIGVDISHFLEWMTL